MLDADERSIVVVDDDDDDDDDDDEIGLFDSLLEYFGDELGVAML